VGPVVEKPAPAPAKPAPAPVKKAPAPVKKAAPPVAPAPVSGEGPLWVEPTAGVCPPSHPVKAKLASRIFHVPGGQNYARTKADRCYRDPAGATSDGLRPAAR
jgi:hypothetical protein